MDSQDQQVLDAALNWAAAGHRLTLVSVARTWGSAPRPPGAWMTLRDDGQVVGSVSGGCVESDLVDRLSSGQLAATGPFVLHYGVATDDARRRGLPCGGRIELVVEPLPDVAALARLRELLAAGNRVQRRVVVGQPGTTLAVAAAGDSHQWDGRTLTTLHGPAWRLLIVGAGQISTYLAQIAIALDYRVVVCDPRQEYAGAWDVAATTLLSEMPDDAVRELCLDAHSAVVALAHDPKLDDLALIEALKSPAFYVGALGSKTTSAQRRARLLEYFDLTPDQVARLRGPVGLPIGSRTPPEIAVSILAEMTAIKHGALGVGALAGAPR
jgi:xanthine dehydrogenase accessory factor